MICSICIATYKRKYLLSNLLKSLFDQKLSKNIKIQVVVVDNDIEKSADFITKEFKNSDKIWLEYYNQPKKNISLTRNICVKYSCGEYLLFIDDDEIADSNWVSEHLNAVEKFDADGGFGLVIPEFPSNTPKWIKRNDYFKRKIPPTGETATSFATSNCIIKSSVLKNESEPFDPKYGLTGGEDTHLFYRLKKNGAKFISNREAIVKDIIPQDRTNIKWLVKKSFQTGNTATRRMIELAESRILKRIFLLFKAIAYLILSILLFIIFLLNIDARIKWLLKIFTNLGHITATFGYNFLGYK